MGVVCMVFVPHYLRTLILERWYCTEEKLRPISLPRFSHGDTETHANVYITVNISWLTHVLSNYLLTPSEQFSTMAWWNPDIDYNDACCVLDQYRELNYDGHWNRIHPTSSHFAWRRHILTPSQLAFPLPLNIACFDSEDAANTYTNLSYGCGPHFGWTH